MRTLVIVLVIFALLCSSIALNYVYINNVENELTVIAHSLDYSDRKICGQKIAEIKSIWQKSSDIFSISVNYKDIDYLGETLLSLSAAFEDKNEQDFERYRLLLIDAIEGVCRLEKLTFFNII